MAWGPCGKAVHDVWERVLPERHSVEGQERVHVGGEWVKRPTGAKGFESRRKHLSLGKDRCGVSGEA